MTMKLSGDELSLLNSCGVMAGMVTDGQLPDGTSEGTAPIEGGAGYDPRPRQTGLVFGTGSTAPGISLAKGTDAGIIWNEGSGADGVPMRANQLDLINDVEILGAGGIDWSGGKVGNPNGFPARNVDILGAAAQAAGLGPAAQTPYVDDNQLTDATPLDHEAGLVFGALFDLEEQTISGYGDASIPDGGIPDTKYDAFFGDAEILEGIGDTEVIGLFGIKMPKFIRKAVAAVTSPVTSVVKGIGKAAKGDFKGALKAVVVDPFKANLALGKDIVKSPLVKVGAGALAVAFPPIGVPIAGGLALANVGLSQVDKMKQAASAAGIGIPPAAALSIADKMVRVADGKVPGKSQAQVMAMKRAIKNTAVLSKQFGNPLQPSAMRAIEQMALALMLQQTRDTQMKRTLGTFSLNRFKRKLNKSSVEKAKAKSKAISQAMAASAPAQTAWTRAIQQAAAPVTTGRTMADAEFDATGNMPGSRILRPTRPAMSGTDVRVLQWALNGHGASPKLKIDGSYGPMTQSATKVYQRANWLTPDGIVGARTWNQLFNSTQGMQDMADVGYDDMADIGDVEIMGYDGVALPPKEQMQLDHLKNLARVVIREARQNDRRGRGVAMGNFQAYNRRLSGNVRKKGDRLAHWLANNSFEGQATKTKRVA